MSMSGDPNHIGKGYLVPNRNLKPHGNNEEHKGIFERGIDTENVKDLVNFKGNVQLKKCYLVSMSDS